MSVERTNFVSVFRTAKIIELDWLTGELDKASIPYQRCEENVSGIRLAMPAAPATGPGKWWSVLVPESHAAQAQGVLESLPLEKHATPDVWDSQPKPSGKLSWQIYATVMLIILALAFLTKLLNAFK